MRLSGNILTEKGNLKPAARAQVLDYVKGNPSILGTAQLAKGSNVYVIEICDAEGNTAYLNIDLSVSTVYPTDRKVPAKKALVAHETETFTIEG